MNKKLCLTAAIVTALLATGLYCLFALNKQPVEKTEMTGMEIIQVETTFLGEHHYYRIVVFTLYNHDELRDVPFQLIGKEMDTVPYERLDSWTSIWNDLRYTLTT